jgi:hypothetical protein
VAVAIGLFVDRCGKTPGTPATNPRLEELDRSRPPLIPAASPPDCHSVTDAMQFQYHIRLVPRGTRRAARSNQNLSQVLKNMDSLAEKSTVHSTLHHFVSFFLPTTSPPIQKPTRVDAGTQRRTAPRPGFSTPALQGEAGIGISERQITHALMNALGWADRARKVGGVDQSEEGRRSRSRAVLYCEAVQKGLDEGPADPLAGTTPQRQTGRWNRPYYDYAA